MKKLWLSQIVKAKITNSLILDQISFFISYTVLQGRHCKTRSIECTHQLQSVSIKAVEKKPATLQLMAQNYVINSFLKARECDAYMYLYEKYSFKHKFKEQSHSVCLSQVLILIF